MKLVKSVTIIDDPQVHEDLHVHAVYDQIASHFSSTRYKPWPIIAKFLSDLPTGWIGLDSGTGNGKYLPLPADRPGSVLTIGLDRSRNLLQIAQHAGSEPGCLITREVVWGDILGSSWRSGVFDYAISIATIHHLASHNRRKLAVQRLLHAVSPAHGRVMIYVWAIEQDELSKRSIPASNAEGSDQHPTTGEDVFVPWVMSQNQHTAKGKCKNDVSPSATSKEVASAVPTLALEAPVYNRYYHMFAKGELKQLTVEAAKEFGLMVGSRDSANAKRRRGVEIIQEGWERSNHYVELRRWVS
ncbi:S-adenosyl-L-methionine-dependent methyltransferase [Suillus decipiens]|nr:S-adenosyl-L-methionine-dependent methyltransferase [Suillus decipiens]